MNRLNLEPGDYFCTHTDSWIATGINIFQKLYSPDEAAKYNHAGIITSPGGDTFEAKKTINNYHLDEYIGTEIVIFRLDDAGPALVKNIIHQLRLDHEGVIYPAWRIVFHVLGPWVARKIGFGKRWLVCSELVAKFLFLMGFRHESFRGTTPDRISDEGHRWKGVTAIGEGVLDKDQDGFFMEEKDGI